MTYAGIIKQEHFIAVQIWEVNSQHPPHEPGNPPFFKMLHFKPDH